MPSTQNQPSRSAPGGEGFSPDGGRKRYLIAPRRGRTLAAAGLRPMSAGHLRGMVKSIPGIEVVGVDVSGYATHNALEEVRPRLQIADARALPFRDDSFDLVISITTLHNLDREGCRQAFGEIERVSRGGQFITVDAWRDAEERRRVEMWNLTALTAMHVDDWKDFFRNAGYGGDYYWFLP